MAAERLTLLEIAIAKAHDMTEIDALLRIQSQVASELLDLAYSAQIPREEALRAILKSFAMMDQVVQKFEKKAVKERDKIIGFDSLTTDTSGVRNAKWFERGLAFATGEATSAVACAIAHPSLGMAASHLNAVTLTDYEKFFRRALIDPQVWLKAMQSNLTLALVSPESLRNTIEQAVNLAYTKFSDLTPGGFPANGAMFGVIGLDFLPRQQVGPYAQHALRVFQQRVSSEGKNLGQFKNVSYKVDWLGSEGGIVYGGRKHPQFNQPVKYNLQYQ